MQLDSIPDFFLGGMHKNLRVLYVYYVVRNMKVTFAYDKGRFLSN